MDQGIAHFSKKCNLIQAVFVKKPGPFQGVDIKDA